MVIKKIITNKNFKFIFILITLLLMVACSHNADKEISIIPKPQKLVVNYGNYKIGSELIISTKWKSDELQNAVNYFCDFINITSEVEVLLTPKENVDGNKSIITIKQTDKENFGSEEYNLTITPKGITIEAKEASGLFYAFQTILQLLPPEVYSKTKVENLSLTLPCVEINDKPQFKWRGFMFDVARWFIPKKDIYKMLDYVAMHKMNIFHLHLGDDQGWRIEIDKYPKLTEVGAWRENRTWRPYRLEMKGENYKIPNYGGFYTKEDIKDILKYAKERFITVIPEIEMPGHCIASLAAYPELSCTGEDYKVAAGRIGRIDRKSYCAGNEATFTFLENVLSEVMELFPSEYIHIGGDEVNYISWKNCDKCQARIKEEGLKDEKELQSYFIKRMTKFINSKGKKIIGWEEIEHGGLPPKATVMAWLGTKAAVNAAKKGHDAILAPHTNFYLDQAQGPLQFEPPAYKIVVKLKDVYSFNTLLDSSLSSEEAKHILGIHSCLWNAYSRTIKEAEYLIFPRFSAIAEVAWTNQPIRNWDNFILRMERQLARYDYANTNYSRSLYNVTPEFNVDKEQRNISVSLENEAYNTSIYYTLDGSEPTNNSQLYSKPFSVNEISLLKAVTYKNGKRISPRITADTVWANIVTGLPVKYKYKYDKKYPSNKEYALTDGRKGVKSFTVDKAWQGILGDDLNVEIDLLKDEEISKISVNLLQANSGGIFFPTSLEFLVSDDGSNYTSVAQLSNTIPLTKPETIIKTFSVSFNPVKARYIKIIAKNIGDCPKGHIYEGYPAYIFVDEIIVE